MIPRPRAAATVAAAAVIIVTAIGPAAASQAAASVGSALGVTAAAASVPRGSWISQDSGTSADLRGVDFVDQSHGWAVGGGGTILRTVDGGAHWTRTYACAQPVPCTATSQDAVTNNLAALSFPGATHGWAVGAGGTILNTLDGGRTWSVELACAQPETAIAKHYCTPVSADRVTKDLTGVSFADDSHGWAVGKGEQILVTADGGATWALQIACRWRTNLDTGPCPPRPAQDPPLDLSAVSFVSAQQGYAVGAEGYSISTVDGGRTWVSNSGGVGPGLLGVDFVTSTFASGVTAQADIVHAVGVAGEVSGNGELPAGKEWQWWFPLNTYPGLGARQPTPSDQNLNGVAFSDHLNGFVVGDGGVAAVTGDGGQSWVVQPTGTTANLYGVSVPDANDGWAVGAGGTILALRTTPAHVRVQSVSPDRGPTDGTAFVVITGRGFTRAREVNFGRMWARGFAVNSDTSITAWLPELRPGRVDVTVVGEDGTSPIVPSDSFSVQAPAGGSWSTAPGCKALACTGPPVMLADGRVLVEGAGGIGGYEGVGGELAVDRGTTEAEIFDPATNSWSTAGSMLHSRALQSAVVLNSGTVLVAGGYDDDLHSTNSAELYDPGTGRWTATGPMHATRADFVMVRLRDGRVLAAGGRDGPSAGPVHATSSAEIYDPSSGRWTEVSHMTMPRSTSVKAVLLPSGTVLVAGGTPFQEHADGVADGSAELFDPATGKWTATGSMTLPRNNFTLTLLKTGDVLAAGGWIQHAARNAITYALAELYDPSTGTWEPTGPMATPHAYDAATLLQNGRVLVTGGEIIESNTCANSTACAQENEAEEYDPGTGGWSEVTPMPLWRFAHDATTLDDGRVLLTGGVEQNETSTVGAATLLFTPASGTTPLLQAFGGGAAMVAGIVAGGVLVAGAAAFAVVGIRKRRGGGRSRSPWAPRRRGRFPLRRPGTRRRLAK